METHNLKVSTPVSLEAYSTTPEEDHSKKALKKKLRKERKALGEMQNTLYAHNKYSVLVCILQHDFLWRHYKALPARGKYAVFNRSHYENVLISRVKPQIVLNENSPHITQLSDITPEFWQQRLQQINNFEETIHQNGCIIFKFFLHISKEEQKNRLLRRLNKPSKNWKFSPEDLKDRELWDEYIHCYEKALTATSTPHAPWYIIPSDSKLYARYLVAKTIKERMESYTDIQNPTLPEELQEQLSYYKKQLRDS